MSSKDRRECTTIGSPQTAPQHGSRSPTVVLDVADLSTGGGHGATRKAAGLDLSIRFRRPAVPATSAAAARD